MVGVQLRPTSFRTTHSLPIVDRMFSSVLRDTSPHRESGTSGAE